MERVTFEEYEAAKAAVLYGKEYEETSSMENNVIHKQYVCKDGSGIFYERTENGVTEFWSTEYSKSRIYADKADEKVELSENRKKAIKRLYKLVYWFADEMLNEEDAEKTDAEYTAAVDNGSYGNFVKDSAGYGLAQWTYWSRKQALLNHAKQAGVSIADLNMQLGFLWEELQGYTAVMDALKKAGSVRAASDAVLTGYEKPADQSETVKKKRAEYGEGYYKKYAAGNGTKYYRVRKSWTDAASQLGAFTSLENAKSACKAGYTVYDDNGKAVYTAAGQQASAGVPFSVQVDILDLNIRTGAGTNYAKTGETTGKGVFTIVEVKAGQGASVGWGRLKSGAGWISLDYVTRLA